MYVFGGYSVHEGYMDDLYSLQLSTQRWFKVSNLGTSPCKRGYHTMASDGTRVFVLGGYSLDAQADELSLIHVFDTKDIKYPEPEHKRIAQLTDELALKSALLEHAAEAAKRAGLELREYADRLLVQTSLVGQHEKELANVRAKLEAKESELEAVRLRLTDAEKSLTKSKAEADTLRAQAATRSANRDEDQISRLTERMRAVEAEIVSKRWNEKSIEEMECRNEG
ncbi:hypothetical protein BGY98DRAFT_680073 [Russula aff. rugulosa BPL654]|nr:hypothetical protein BGY98DRAFT_680073 [Russula aff. rugulosa BPL654]